MLLFFKPVFKEALDCIDYKLLIAKLSTYGLYNSSLNCLYSRLKHRKEQIKLFLQLTR